MAPWEVLWPRAMACIASLEGHFPPPDWTFGGGTALMLLYEHRRSKDIDIFLRDPQYLTALSPRLNDHTEALTGRYVEQSNFLKLICRDRDQGRNAGGDRGEKGLLPAGRVFPARRLRLRLRPRSRPASDSRQPRDPHREKRCAVAPSRTVANTGALRRPSPRRPRSPSQGSALSGIGDGEGLGVSGTLQRSGTLRPGPVHSLEL